MRVTNKMIAERAIEKGLTSDNITAVDMEIIHGDFRREAGIIENYSWRMGMAREAINDERCYKIWTLMDELAQ